MGKGDRKTKKGKIRLGSFGKLRPRKKNTNSFVIKKAAKKTVENKVDISIEETTKKKTTKKKAATKKKVATKKKAATKKKIPSTKKSTKKKD